jgi:hypothetical protein
MSRVKSYARCYAEGSMCSSIVKEGATIGARLLVELGMEPTKAIASVRAARPGAIETWEQEKFALGIRPSRT